MSDPVHATISKEWKQRMWLMMAVLVGIGGWFLFDGLVGYPRHNEWAGVYFQLAEKHEKDSPELVEEWKKVTAERQWPSDIPKKMYLPGDITMQIVLGLAGWIGAGLVFLHYRRSLPTATRMENDRIFLPDGREIPIDSVRVMSLRRWKNKGIADFAYEPSPGTSGKFLLDDYKYAGADRIVAEIEKRLAPPAAE